MTVLLATSLSPAPVDESNAPLERRMKEWGPGYTLVGPEQRWIFRLFIAATLQIDSCRSREHSLRVEQARRARLSWDDDRRLEAEETGSRLAKKPSLVMNRLRRTRQGCEWLLSRWLFLAAALENGGTWDEIQIALAFDLLGTPLELRGASPVAADDTPHDLVERETAGLQRRVFEALEEIDEAERTAAERGEPVETSRELARVRRDEAASLRRMQWALPRLTRATAPAPELPRIEEAAVEPEPADDLTPEIEPASPQLLPSGSIPLSGASLATTPARTTYPNRRVRRAAMKHMSARS